MTSSNDTLAHLAEVITTRRQASPDKSYVARLFSKGTDAILKKIGEEATEVVMACKDADRERIVGEMADLWFHSMLALSAFDLSPADVLAELQRREGQSGLEEFALRKSQSRDAERDAERGAEDGAERDAKREAEQVANPQGESK
jgi:phosphoribosyl-ATP pyrophosphohydrolase